MNTLEPGDRVRCTMPTPKWQGQLGTIKRPAGYPPCVYLVTMDDPSLNTKYSGVSVFHECCLERISDESPASGGNAQGL